MSNISPDNIKLKDWISVGRRDCVVCHIYENESNKVEVVYLDRDRAINEDVHFVDGKWSFVYNDPCVMQITVHI